MPEYRNLTVRLPLETLRRIRRLAADRDTSVSALVAQAVAELAERETRYAAARKSALKALDAAKSLGTRGTPSWTRDQLHER